MRRALPIVCMSVALAGCTVGPNYKRPAVAAPPAFRAGESQPTAASLGDAKWFDVFQDDALRDLVREALAANYDVLIAAQRVLQAEGQVSATRSSIYPQINAQAGSDGYGIQSSVQRSHYGILAASWEPDLFGRLRRSSEAARADLLAIDENRKGVMQALVAQVATAYFDLRDYDAELEDVLESIAARRQSVHLVAAREQGGVASMLELDQAKSLVASAQAQQALLEKAQAQTENLINFLIGKEPGPVKRGHALVN